jgi:hypothetical protein
VTTSADVSWSAWPVHPTFPPIIHEMVRFVAGGRSLERQKLVGEPLLRPLSSRESALPIVVRTPDGSEHSLRPVQNEKVAQVVYPETTRRGMYEILVGPASAPKTPPSGAARAEAGRTDAARSEAARRELFAVNVDTRESDLEPVDEKTLHSTTLAGIPYVHRSEWSEGPRDTADGGGERSGLASWLLVAIVALLLVEPLLAWSFRHGFVLLCTLAACGVVAPWLPHNLVGGLVVAVLLAGGAVAMAFVGRERLT